MRQAINQTYLQEGRSKILFFQRWSPILWEKCSSCIVLYFFPLHKNLLFYFAKKALRKKSSAVCVSLGSNIRKVKLAFFKPFKKNFNNEDFLCAAAAALFLMYWAGDLTCPHRILISWDGHCSSAEALVRIASYILIIHTTFQLPSLKSTCSIT